MSAVALFHLAGQAPGDPGSSFTEVTGEAEVGYLQWNPPPGSPRVSPQVMTGGAAVADYDGDGWPDLFVTRYRGTDLLFRNLGDGTFEEVAAAAGIDAVAPSNGAAWGDIDNDGDPDLYLSVVDESAAPLRYLLYINAGDGTFTEEAVARGAARQTAHWQSGFSTCFGDYDRDGWLDIHTCQWSVVEAGNRSVLLRNRGPGAPGHFVDATAAAGVEMWAGDGAGGASGAVAYAFTSRLSDLDGDGWPDLVVAADYGTSRLFWADGDGTFTDGTAAAGIGGDENGMGLAVGDYDGDGAPDLFFTSIYDARGTGVPFAGWGVTGNRLYRNLGGRRFEDATDAAGVRDGGWGWGAAFLDHDNDGDLDLAMTNGFANDGAGAETPFHTDPTRLWRNDGGRFTDVAAEAGITDVGEGKGLLVFDYDRDGDLDLFVVNHGGAPVLYRNDLANGNHWLRVRARGRCSNRDGVGVVVGVLAEAGGVEQRREIGGGSHFLTGSEKVAHFGLGPSGGAVAELRVRWPSGIEQCLEGVAVDQEIELTEPPSPYAAWLEEFFTEPERALEQWADPLADPDGDGLQNGVEFGCGLDPRRAQGLSPIEISGAEGGGVTVRYRRRSLPRGVEVVLERSADLAGWEEVGAGEFELRSTEPAGGWGVETVVGRLGAGSGHLRVRVTVAQ